MALLPAWSLAPVPPGHTRRPMSGPAILTWNCMLSGGCGGTRRVDGRELAENSDPPRVIRRGDWTPTRRYPVDARTKLDRRGVKVARGTASASALSSPSSPAPAVRSPRPPNSCPLCARSPSGTMSKGRDATTITDSTGRRRLTKLWDGAAAARCGRLRAGPAATPRRPLDRVGSTAFWSCALAIEPLPPPRRPPRRTAPTSTPSTRRRPRDCVRAMACDE